MICKYINPNNTSSPLGYSSGVFDTKGLTANYLNCYLNPKIFFKQEIGFYLCDIGASI